MDDSWSYMMTLVFLTIYYCIVIIVIVIIDYLLTVLHNVSLVQ